MPSVITFTDGNTLTYGYDAAGSKLSVAYTVGGSTVKTEYADNKVYNNGTLCMFLTGEGYITLSGGTPTYHYYLKDHQGNNWVVINQSGTVQQVNHYYPFGGLFGEGIQTSNQPYKYNGKELDRFQGMDMYDYGARHYDAALGRWLTVDPMAEKYYSISPYVYTANNPVRFIDPNGMVIDSLSQEAWDEQKNRITTLRDKLIDRNRNGRNDNRITSLDNTLSDMASIENSKDIYSLSTTKEKVGYLKYDVNTGNMVIEYNGTANFAHEVTHGGQYERGEIGFNTQTGNSIGQDLWDEVGAYRSQFNYDPASIRTARNINDITPGWVQNITDSNGNQPYAPGGSSNTGQYPLNGNSKAYDIMMAYPTLRNQIIPIALRLPPLRSYQNHKFK